MKHSRIYAALAIVLAAASVITACGNDVSTEGKTTENSNASDTGIAAATESDPRDAYTDTAPVVEDLGGYEFRMAVRNGNEQVSEQVGYWTEAESGDTINDAVYRRNRAVEEMYNTTISLVLIPDTGASARKSIQAGDDFCDILFGETITSLIDLAQINALVDLNTLPELGLTNPWWDQRIADIALYGQQYFATGDITMEDDLCEMCVMYNKTLYNQYDLPDSYEMVTGGTWTLEQMMSLVRGVTQDINGDGEMTVADQWGLLSETYAGWYLFLGSGNDTIAYENDAYVSKIAEEAYYDIFNAAVETLISDEVIIINNGKYDKQVTTSDIWAEASKMFQENRVLFRTGTFSGTLYLRNMKTDFGVLPIPKYTEEQEEYYCMVSNYSAPLSMPTTVQNQHAAALVTEAMAFESMFTLTPRFYEVFLDEKILRDEQSKEMVDILLDSKVYSLDFLASITGMDTQIGNMVDAGKNNLASKIASIENSAQNKLDKFTAKFES